MQLAIKYLSLYALKTHSLARVTQIVALLLTFFFVNDPACATRVLLAIFTCPSVN